MSERKTALSEQQIRIVTLASMRMTNRQIAERLQITEGSVDTQFQRMRAKLGTDSRAQTVVVAMELIAEREGQESMRFAELAQGMPILLIAFDASHAIVATNDAADRLFAFTLNRVDEGLKTWKQVVPGATERRRRRHVLGTDYENYRARMTTAKGEECVIAWFSAAQSHPIPGWHFWVVGVDVTDMERDEVLGRLRHIASESSEAGVWLLDDGFKTLYTNSAVADILETTEQDLLLMSPLDFIPEEQRAAAYEFIKLGGGTIEITLKTAQGNPRKVRKTLTFGDIGLGSKPEGYAIVMEAVR